MGLVEREAQLAVLVDELALAASSGRLVLISGEPGVGKSALIEQFRTSPDSSVLAPTGGGLLRARNRCKGAISAVINTAHTGVFTPLRKKNDTIAFFYLTRRPKSGLVAIIKVNM